MYSVRVATTDDRQSPPAEDWPGLTWERLCDVLRYEASPQAASLFAEPVADPALGVTHWHIVANEDPKPFAALEASERGGLLRAFEALRAEILACADKLAATGVESKLRLAAGLRAAIADIDPETQLWSVAGAPLVTGWGRRKTAAPKPDARIIARAPPQDAAGAPAGVSAGARPPERTAAAAAIPRPHFRALAPWLWWLPFLALVAAIFYLLLPACAIDLPLLRDVAGWCAPGRAGLDEVAGKNDALRRALFETQQRIALKPACPPESQRRTGGIPPGADEAKSRAREARLARGRMDVTLAWTGREDLDLHIFCAGGHLFHGQLSACGGTLDRDRNRNGTAVEESPIEHAAWEREPPPGEYRVVVVYYGANDAPPRAVPFTVVIRDGDNERVVNGEVDGVNKAVEATRFQR